MLGIATQKHDTIQLISLENFALPLTNTYFDTDLETEFKEMPKLRRKKEKRKVQLIKY